MLISRPNLHGFSQEHHKGDHKHLSDFKDEYGGTEASQQTSARLLFKHDKTTLLHMFLLKKKKTQPNNKMKKPQPKKNLNSFS